MTSQELTVRQKTDAALEYFRTDEMIEQVRYALPEGESPRKFVRTLATALMENQELVLADRNSLVTAVFKAAQMGLLPDGQEGVINVYNTKVKDADGKDRWIQKATFIPMVTGYAKRVAEYGWSLVADVVYENDTFDEGSTEKPLFHRRAKLGTDRGQPIGAFALAVHGTLGFRQEIFTKEQIELIRSKSRQPNGQLWTTWWDRAWKKTVAKQVAKRLPLNSADKERLAPVLDDNGDDPTTVLYGDRRAGGSSLPVPSDAREGVEAGPQPRLAPSLQPEPDDDPEVDAVWEPIPDEADLPPSPAPTPPAEPAPPPEDEPVIKSGRYEGATLEDLLALGDDGVSHLRYLYRNWNTSPLREALDRFGEEHPEIKGQS